MEVFSSIDALLLYTKDNLPSLLKASDRKDLPFFYRQKMTVRDGLVEFIPKLKSICYCGKPLNPRFIFENILKEESGSY